MLLYHFTGHCHLPSILKEGLTRGEVPLSALRTLNAVNLTSSSDPRGHGLNSGGEVMTEEQRQAWFRTSGQMLPEGLRYTNKRAVRITVKLPSTDRRLERWLPWARKKLDPAYLHRLIEAGGGGMRSAKTWWLYWGEISPESFVAVDVLEADVKAA